MIFNPVRYVKGVAISQTAVTIVTRGTSAQPIYYNSGGVPVEDTIPGAKNNLTATVTTTINADAGTIMFINTPSKNASVYSVSGATGLAASSGVYQVDA